MTVGNAIFRLTDFSDPHTFDRCKKIDRSDLRLLWHSDFWDGPISGMLVYREEECWFKMVAEDLEVFDASDGWFRRFAVIRLTSLQHSEEAKWHLLFRDKVGTHTDYDETGYRTNGTPGPSERWNEFYDAFKLYQRPDYSENEVLGWFEM